MENQIMTEVLLFATAIGLIVSLAVETVKRTFDGIGRPIRPALVPVVAFVVGILLGAVAYPFTDMELVLRLWAGGISGWMASGLYETVKQTKKA